MERKKRSIWRPKTFKGTPWSSFFIAKKSLYKGPYQLLNKSFYDELVYLPN